MGKVELSPGSLYFYYITVKFYKYEIKTGCLMFKLYSQYSTTLSTYREIFQHVGLFEHVLNDPGFSELGKVR